MVLEKQLNGIRRIKMFKDAKVVVTGGSGFIGTHFINELLSRGANVRTHTHVNPLKINDDRIEVIDKPKKRGKGF